VEAPGARDQASGGEEEVMRRTVTGQETNFQKMSWHADQAERLQAQIEEMENAAVARGATQQQGRMERADATLLPDSYVADTLLRDSHQYRRLVGIRNGHQEQIQMYAALIAAGHQNTGNIRVNGEMRIRNNAQ
jgi:hypothetical protein